MLERANGAKSKACMVHILLRATWVHGPTPGPREAPGGNRARLRKDALQEEYGRKICISQSGGEARRTFPGRA
jgi:hypothetical protein